MTQTRDYPYSIFKYCDFSINQKTNKINSLENLKNNQVWLSNPISFNDPFDCSVAFDANKIMNEIVKKNIYILKSFLDYIEENELSTNKKEIILKSEKPIDELKKNLSEIFREPLIKEINREYKQTYINGCMDFNTKYKSKLKVSCFSEVNASLLMWGHYADNHQGFCVEYDLGSLDKTNNLKKYLFPIEYVDSMIDMTEYYLDNVLNRKNINKEKLIESVLYKMKEWSYEEEWRIVISENEYNIFNFDTPTPKAIYLGCNIKNTDKYNIISIANNMKIPVFQMQPDYKKYFLNVNTL